MSTDEEPIPVFVLAVTTICIFLLCQAITYYLTAHVDLPIQVFSTPMLELNLVHSENRGVNFGLMAGDDSSNQFILAGIAILVGAVMATILLGKRRVSHAIAGGMIFGGALSNVMDRLTFGYVFDYINTPFLGMTNPFSYNIADIFIVLPIIWWIFKS
ncbi:lipoprotein signal peptidase [Roseobacter sp. AzwK-3b]|uniref:signal peptidase II n=1 Tax=Roseobacter sp. AzwK-3b TaxID=351016 RepID=UPI000156A1C1|nr:signal peptidase II [Roseobacter sp. AzwK-3b]EDM69402.1 lipoprotein signal peptidase [Roseobacter sp. AzwK-3b]